MGTLSMLGKSSVTEITDNSILKLDLGCTVDERASEDDFVSTLLNDSPAPTGLDEILHAIETAKQDSRISGIYIECNGISAGTASLYEIRKALADFKKESGKFIYAYGDNMSQADYYLASAADSIFINTIGSLDLRGLAVSVPFFKKALDKIGVEMQIVRVGTFKSAVEPYILTEMSNANRLQYSTFVNNIWGNIILGLVWICSIIGIVFNAINMHKKSIKILSMILYVVMGWCIILAIKPLLDSWSIQGFIWMLVGGIAYTVGIIFYGLGKNHKYIHSIWHLFVLLGTILQFIAIFVYIIL